MNQLQIIQNTTAKVVTGKYKYDLNGTDLNDLHWLTISKRIVFKISLLVFKSLMGWAPQYLQDLLYYKKLGQRNELHVPKFNKKLGARAFCTAAPYIWNKLPASIRECDTINSFKSKLKTFLFNLRDDEVSNIFYYR